MAAYGFDESKNKVEVMTQEDDGEAIELRFQGVYSQLPRYFEFDTDNLTAGSYIDLYEAGFNEKCIVIGASFTSKTDGQYYALLNEPKGYGIKNVSYFPDDENTNVRVTANDSGLPSGYICKICYIKDDA